jgi:drug/metabolite transporter superfamily protein YnfA
VILPVRWSYEDLLRAEHEVARVADARSGSGNPEAQDDLGRVVVSGLAQRLQPITRWRRLRRRRRYVVLVGVVPVLAQVALFGLLWRHFGHRHEPKAQLGASASDMVRAMRTIGLGKSAALVVFVVAAALEVAGDALVRRGLRSSSLAVGALGVLVLGSYGIVVNLLPLDFSRLLGAYVAVFAVVSVGTGVLVFGDRAPASTWIGLAVVVLGSLIIHFGPRR